MKYIRDCSREELEQVFNTNAKLREEIFDYLMESASTWVDEYLSCWDRRGIKYDLSGYGYSYFKSKDNFKFLAGLQEAQRVFCFLPDSMNDKIDYAQKLVNRLWEVEDTLSEANYERLSGRVDELIDELEDACLKRFKEEYDACCEEKYQLEEWLSYLSEEKSDCYIDDRFKMYEIVITKKEYA